MGPLVIGLAAGALGFFLGALRPGEKKEQPAQQPQPDPRIDQIQQSQQRQELLLQNILAGMGQLQQGQITLQQGQQQIANTLAGGAGPQVVNNNTVNVQRGQSALQNAAAMGTLFGNKATPAEFFQQLDRLFDRLPQAGPAQGQIPAVANAPFGGKS